MPDVAYTPRDAGKNLSAQQTWTFRGESFAPSSVVEIDELAGEGSQRRALDRKMRNEYFQHSVQLEWLIDPRPNYQIMFEYKINTEGKVDCDGVTRWRDLDGGDVLPGFSLNKTDLEMVLNQDPGSSSEDEVHLQCPYPRCRKRFRSPGAWTAHAEWHRASSFCERWKTRTKRRKRASLVYARSFRSAPATEPKPEPPPTQPNREYVLNATRSRKLISSLTKSRTDGWRSIMCHYERRATSHDPTSYKPTNYEPPSGSAKFLVLATIPQLASHSTSTTTPICLPSRTNVPPCA